jgi:MATE family multidrug resistance protein
VALGLGVATAIIGQIVALGLPLVAEGSEAVRVARQYVTIRLIGAPLVLLAFAIREVRTGLGDSQSPMRAAVIANLVHIPLNFVLMSGLGLGVLGVAVSTVLSQGLEAALLVFVQRSDEHGLGLRAWTRRDVADLQRTGFTLGLERLFNVASFTVLVTVVARVSDVDLAAHQVAHQVNLFAILPMMALAEAASVLSGQAVGAGETQLVRRVARIATGTGLAYGALSALVYVVFGSAVTHTLTPDENVAALSARLLWVGAACHVFTAAYLVAGSVLRGAGDIRYATLAMVIIAWVVTPPLAVQLGIRMGLGALGGWLSLLVEWGVGAFVLVLRVERLGWLPAAHRARARLLTREHDLPAVELARS